MSHLVRTWGIAGIVGGLLALSARADHHVEIDLPTLSQLLEEQVALTHEADTVVTATRYAQRVDRTPSNVHVITRQEIEALAPKHAADLLRFIPGLAVPRRQQLGHELGAAGTGGQFSNKVLVLLDGHRVTRPGFGSVPWLLLPIAVDELERVEVVFGPGSAVYGTSAFAAVVNFITQGPDSGARGRVRVAAGNRGYSTVSAHVRQVLEGGTVSGVVQAEGRGGFGPMVDTGGRPDASFPAEEDLRRRMARFSHQLTVGEGRTLNYSVAATQASVQGVPQLPGVRSPNPEEHRGAFLAADYEQRLGEARALTVRSTYYQLERRLERPPLAVFGVRDVHLDSSLADLELTLRHRWGAWSAITGGTVRRVTGSGYATNGTDDDAFSSALFVQGERNFGDRFVVYLGAREVFQDLAQDEFSWNVAALYRPRPHTAWRLGLGTSFRHPDLVADRIVNASTFMGQPLNSPAFQSNPDLQSEVAREFLQLGWERRWRGATLSLDAYTAKLERRIEFVPFGPTVQTTTPPFTSLGRPGQRFENSMFPARVRGVTLAGEKSLGLFQLKGTLTLQDVVGVPNQADAPYAPHQFGSLQLLLPASPDRRWSGALSLHGLSSLDVDRSALLDGAPPRLPGWVTTDLTLTRRTSARSRVTLSMRNLLDNQRREMVYSLIGDNREQGVQFGREVWLGVTFDL